jgi:HK97 family phage major capsid protein
MSAVDLGMEMGPLIIAAAVDGLGYGILNADGTSTYNSMTGLLNEATAGYVSSLPNTKTAFSDVTKGDLTAAKAKALLRAQNIGSWIMSTYILGLCEDFDRTGKREAVTTDNQGVTRLLGNKVVIDAYMPGSAASASATGFAIFGDMKTMFVGLVGGMEIGVSEHVRFDKNQTVIRLVLNGQYQRKPFAGLITVKTAAA